jgi:hypothetical protein
MKNEQCVRHDVARGRATFRQGGNVTPGPWVHLGTQARPTTQVIQRLYKEAGSTIGEGDRTE